MDKINYQYTVVFDEGVDRCGTPWYEVIQGAGAYYDSLEKAKRAKWRFCRKPEYKGKKFAILRKPCGGWELVK